MTKLIDVAPIFGSTIFCEDVRVENTGKLIIIGVYQGSMMVHVPFPFKIPVISFFISLQQKADIFDPKVTYRIFLPGDPDDASSDAASIVAEMGETVPGAASKHADAAAELAGIPKEAREYVHSAATLQFQQVEIKQPGIIKVRADIAGNRYRLGSLSVVPTSKT